MFISSAPGETLLPSSRGTHGTISSIRQDAVTRTVVSEIKRDVASARAMVSDIHRNVVRGQEGNGGDKSLVSGSQILSIIERLLTIPQTQARSVIRLSMVLFSYISIQHTRRIPTPATKDLFRPRRINREGYPPRRRPSSDCSHRCGGDWEDLCRPGRSPPRSDQEAIWSGTSVHPL